MRHLRLYRAIRLIHRQGSIRKAAEKLAVSPSALNRSIQGFEEEFGTDVFERIPGGVRLSSAGELLMELIDRHLTEYDALIGQVSDLRDGLSGHLRLSVGSDLDAGLVPEVVAAFEHAHPGVSVEMISSDSVDLLRQRLVDLAILTNPQTDDGVEVLHSAKVALGAWQGGGARDLAAKVGLWDIVAGRLVLPPDATGSRSAISHLLRRHHLEEGVSTSVTAAQAWPRMRSGASVAIFPEVALTPLTRPQGLVRLPIALGTVQCAILRAAKVPMTRPAQTVFAMLQGRLDNAEADNV